MEAYEEIERKIFLIKTYLDGELSPEEDEELKKWLESSEENQAIFRRVQDKKILLEKLEFCRRTDSSSDWKMVRRGTRSFFKRSLYSGWMRYAAVFIGLFAVTFAVLKLSDFKQTEQFAAIVKIDSIRPGFRQAYIELGNGEKIVLGDSVNRIIKNIEGGVLKEMQEGLVMLSDDSLKDNVQKIEYNRIIVPRGGEYQLTLSDGTRVWLNSDSKLEFPVAFANRERKVRLSGEAYFQVKRNESMPFLIEVNAMEIKVLGTSFNVQAYDKMTRTTLVEGSVEVNVGGTSYRLSPGYEAKVNDGKVTVEKVDMYEQTAWKDGKFVFREKCLEEVMTILGRWYDIDVFYQNTAVKELHFTGNIPRHATIGEVLKFLERTHLVHFNIVGRTVVVSM
ncbi:MAG: FecR domain-containing protein [Odoribacter sp.]